MPSTQCGPGGRATIAADYHGKKGFRTRDLLEAEDQAIITAAVDTGGLASIRLHVIAFHPGATLPTAKSGSGYARGPAYEVAFPSDADDAVHTQRSFNVHAEAITIDPAAPPSSPAVATAIRSAPVTAKRTPVVLAKAYEAHDDAKWFAKTCARQLELNGWTGASKEQIAEQVLANVSPDVAAGLKVDGARTMPAADIFTLLGALPRRRNAFAVQQLEVARAKCTDSEDFVSFIQNLLHRIVTAYEFETIREWVDSSKVAGHEEHVCQLIVNILYMAAPPRLHGVITTQMHLISAVTTVTALSAARAKLLELGSTNATLRNVAAPPSSADVFSMSTQVHTASAPPPTDMAAIATALAELATTVAELKQDNERRSRFDPARHDKCKRCNGLGTSADGSGKPGEHSSWKCPGKP